MSVSSKAKNEANQRILERITSEMNGYNSDGNHLQKQMSLSQMKSLTKKKPSTDQLSLNEKKE